MGAYHLLRVNWALASLRCDAREIVHCVYDENNIRENRQNIEEDVFECVVAMVNQQFSPGHSWRL